MKHQILRLGKDSLIYGLGSVITRFIGLLMLPLFTAYLKPKEYGVLSMLALLTMVAQPVFSLGLSAAMGPSYFDGNNPHTKSEAVWTVFTINMISASLLVALAWTFPEILGQLVRLPAEYAFLVGLTLTGSALTILVTSFTQQVQFEKHARLYILVTIATSLTAIFLSVLMVVFLGWGVQGMVVGQLAGNIVTFFAFLLIGFNATKPAISMDMAKKLLRQGLPLVPSFAFLFILMHANKFILEREAGLGVVGIYSIGFNLGMGMSIVTGGIATAWYPFFMSFINRQKETEILFGRILTYYVFVVGFICLLFFLGAKPVVLLLTKGSFNNAYSIVGLVALGNFAQTLFNFFLPGVYFHKDIRVLSLVQGLAALVALPINYLFIVNFGMLGAGIGIAANNIFMAGLMFGWNCLNRSRYTVIKYEWARVFSFILFFLGIILIYMQLPATSTTSEIIKTILISGLAFFGMFFLLNKQEKSILIQKLTNK